MQRLINRGGHDRLPKSLLGKSAATGAMVLLIAGTGAFAGLGGPGGGDTHTWTGNLNTSWHNSANWNTGQMPAAGDAVIVLDGANHVFLFNDTAQIHSLYIGGPRVVVTNGHQINATHGTGTVTLTGQDSVLSITPNGNSYSVVTDEMLVDNFSTLNMVGGWLYVHDEFDALDDSIITGNGYIDVHSANDAAFNMSGATHVDVGGGDMYLRMYGGGSMVLPPALLVNNNDDVLTIQGDIFNDVNDIVIGSDNGILFTENWTLAGDLMADTADGGQAHVGGAGQMFIEGSIDVATNSSLRITSIARFENTSEVNIGSFGSLTLADWYNADAGSSTQVAWGGKLQLDGQALPGGWNGDISTSAATVEVNSAAGLALNGSLNLGSLFGLKSFVSGSQPLYAFGEVNVPGLGAVINGTLDVRHSTPMTLGANAEIVINGMMYLRGESETTGGGLLTVGEAGTLVIEEYAGTAADLLNNGSFQIQADGEKGYVYINGAYTQTETGSIQFDIGDTANTERDVFESTESSTLAGEVVVNLIDGFVPQIGDEFEIIWASGGVNGMFDVVSGEPGFEVSYSPSIVTLTYVGVEQCPADLSGDGTVDGIDLLELLGNWGACGKSCDSDLTDDGIVDVSDLLVLLGAWGACN